MRDYRDETISALCYLLNMSDGLTEDEETEYNNIISEYITYRSQLSEQKTNVTETYFIVRIEGRNLVYTYEDAEIEKLLRDVSKYYCFSDYCDSEVIEIVYKGSRVAYIGWQPDMKFEYFHPSSGSQWVFYFPEWEH